MSKEQTKEPDWSNHSNIKALAQWLAKQYEPSNR